MCRFMADTKELWAKTTAKLGFDFERCFKPSRRAALAWGGEASLEDPKVRQSTCSGTGHPRKRSERAKRSDPEDKSYTWHNLKIYT